MPPRVSEAEGIDNFQLPKALVTRIAKSALLADTKLQKDTIHVLVDTATVFINYLAATAHDVALSRYKKTITAPDIIKAMEIIELGDLVSLLESELEVYRGGPSKGSKQKGVDKKGKGKEKEPSTAEGPSPDAEQDEQEEQQDHMEDEEEQEEEEEEDEDEEPEPLVNTTVMKQEELRKDTKGLDDDAMSED